VNNATCANAGINLTQIGLNQVIKSGFYGVTFGSTAATGGILVNPTGSTTEILNLTNSLSLLQSSGVGLAKGGDITLYGDDMQGLNIVSNSG
jgi:hypothetical protein